MSTVVHTSSYLQTSDFFPFLFVSIMGALFLFSTDRVSHPVNILMAEPAELVAPVVVVVNVVVVVVVVSVVVVVVVVVVDVVVVVVSRSEKENYFIT